MQCSEVEEGLSLQEKARHQPALGLVPGLPAYVSSSSPAPQIQRRDQSEKRKSAEVLKKLQGVIPNLHLNRALLKQAAKAKAAETLAPAIPSLPDVNKACLIVLVSGPWILIQGPCRRLTMAQLCFYRSSPRPPRT